jgi:hypothetical protein
MNYKLFLTTIILYSFIQIAVGQTKNEKEKRIKIFDFPEMAQNIIKILPKDCKRIRFYKETDGAKYSYEAKFKYNKRRYSLEFSKDGIIEDIEVITKLKHLKKQSKINITSYLEKTFKKYKIIKIQDQYIYKNQLDVSQFLKDILNNISSITPNFEIIAEVKKKKEREIREFTFNNAGEFLKSRVLNPTSYEHVLY